MEARTPFLTPDEAVEDLRKRGFQTTSATLKNWRSGGKSGLRFYKVAGRVFYSRDDIEAWINQCRFAEGGRRDPRPVTPAASAEATAQREGNV